MKTYYEEHDDLNVVYELEEATEIVDKMQNTVESTNLDESLCDKLINFPSPKVSASRRGVKSMHMEQMVLLKKIDPKIFKDDPANKIHCCTHECNHCKILMKISWKVK